MSRKINVRVTMDVDSREVVRMFYKTTYFGTPNDETLNFDEWAGNYLANTVKYFSSSPELYKEYIDILEGKHPTAVNDRLSFMSK